jgi:hypothetical protein
MTLFYSLAIQNGYGKYKITILISDGSDWVKQLKTTLFGDNVIHILDYSSLTEKISIFANYIFTDENNAQSWAKEMSDLFSRA